MARMLGNNETAFKSAGSQFWVVDANVSSRWKYINSLKTAKYGLQLDLLFLIEWGNIHLLTF